MRKKIISKYIITPPENFVNPELCFDTGSTTLSMMSRVFCANYSNTLLNEKKKVFSLSKTSTVLSMKEKNSEVSVKAGLYNYRIFIAIDSY